MTGGGTHSALHAQRYATRSEVHIDPARAASLIELPAAFHPLLAAKLAHEKLRREQEVQKKLRENDWGPFRTAIGRRDAQAVYDGIVRNPLLRRGETAFDCPAYDDAEFDEL